MKRYLHIYWFIFSASLKAALEYRWNFFVQLFYAPAYVFVLFMLLNLAFLKTPSLAGWTKAEALLLFTSFHLVYTTAAVLCIKSIRELLWSGIRLGQLDLMLTKPMNTQFLATFYKPEIQQLFLFAILVGYFIYQLLNFSPAVAPLNLILFFGFYALGVIIVYLTLSTYATAGFYVTRAQQVIEFFDKAADQAQYPMPIFPGSVQALFFTIFPIAYAGFVPASFLLGRGSGWLAGLTVVTVVLLAVLNRWAWHFGLRQYSSASS